MSEPPGVPSALGIEGVEWFARDDENLTVRVTGRWRRRRPALSGQPLLVIEADGQRHRFAAIAEPPGLTGAAPGTWQLSFTVPATLTPPALERAWLQMGAVVVPLPVAVQSEGAAEPEADAEAELRGALTDEAADPQLLAERRLRSSELALQATRLRASQAEQTVADLAARVEELERELEMVRLEPARLQALLIQREAARRAAEQRAHAERAMRTELQEELARFEGDGGQTDAALEELQFAHRRVAELEARIDQLSRKADEAEQLAAAARVARERAQAALEGWVTADRESAVRSPGLAARIAAEERLWRKLAADTEPPALPQLPHGQSTRALEAERRLIEASGRLSPGASADEATLRALREELATRAAGEAKLRRRIAQLAGTSSAVAPDALGLPEAPPARVLTETLVALREELLQLRSLAETERERRRAAEACAHELEAELSDYMARSAAAYAAIQQLRAELEHLRPAAASGTQEGLEAPGAGAAPAPGDAPPAPGDAPHQASPRAERGHPERRASLDPARLDAALSRLRESAAADEESPTPPDAGSSGPWMAGAFALLSERDAVAAGRLLLALLPAQGLVRPEPMAYDLVLDNLGCVQVSVAGPSYTTLVRLTETPRPVDEVTFALTGDLRSLAALVASGSLRRRFGRRRARITYDRGAASALLALVHTPVSLEQLLAAGVRLDPWLALTVASLMIDPAWTRGEHFSVAFQEPGGATPSAYLHVRDGRRPTVSSALLSESPESTVICAGERVLSVLDGDLGVGAQLRGETRPLALLQRWIERAQSG